MSLERQDQDPDAGSVARLAAGAAVHTAGWAMQTGFGLGRRLLRASSSPAEAVEFAQDVATAARVLVNGVADVAARVSTNGEAGEVEQETTSLRSSVVAHGRDRVPAKVDLRAMGTRLLEKSRDVWDESVAHPAYERILGELAPDEGRMLLLLLRSGPQATVDVRTGGPVGVVSSELIAANLNMIGARSGVRYVDQVPSYLNNLFRLGLIWFSREQVRDPLDYQVVEAQPDVLSAMHSVRFPKVVRRSIHLTPFGEDFCRTCLIEEAADVEVLPPHQAPTTLD